MLSLLFQPQTTSESCREAVGRSRVMERRLARRREMRDISVGPETVRGVVVGVDEVKGLSEECGVALSVTSAGGRVS